MRTGAVVFALLAVILASCRHAPAPQATPSPWPTWTPIALPTALHTPTPVPIPTPTDSPRTPIPLPTATQVSITPPPTPGPTDPSPQGNGGGDCNAGNANANRMVRAICVGGSPAGQLDPVVPIIAFSQSVTSCGGGGYYKITQQAANDLFLALEYCANDPQEPAIDANCPQGSNCHTAVYLSPALVDCNAFGSPAKYAALYSSESAWTHSTSPFHQSNRIFTTGGKCNKGGGTGGPNGLYNWYPNITNGGDVAYDLATYYTLGSAGWLHGSAWKWMFLDNLSILPPSIPLGSAMPYEWNTLTGWRDAIGTYANDIAPYNVILNSEGPTGAIGPYPHNNGTGTGIGIVNWTVDDADLCNTLTASTTVQTMLLQGVLGGQATIGSATSDYIYPYNLKVAANTASVHWANTTCAGVPLAISGYTGLNKISSWPQRAFAVVLRGLMEPKGYNGTFGADGVAVGPRYPSGAPYPNQNSPPQVVNLKQNTVYPEDGLVMTGPIQTPPTWCWGNDGSCDGNGQSNTNDGLGNGCYSADAGGVNGFVQLCGTIGVDAMGGTAPVYVREFTACYKWGMPYGPCAVVANMSTTATVTLSQLTFSNTYTRELTPTGGELYNDPLNPTNTLCAFSANCTGAWAETAATGATTIPPCTYLSSGSNAAAIDGMAANGCFVILLGAPTGIAYIGALVNPTASPPPPPYQNQVQLFESQVYAQNGYNHAIGTDLHFYNWAALTAPNSLTSDPAITDDVAHARIPFITWRCGSSSAPYNTVTLTNIANGVYDASIINPTAIAFKNLNTPVFLRWFHEFNFNYQQTTQNAQSPLCFDCYTVGPPVPQPCEWAEYVAAWKHIYNQFQINGATNVIFAWTPDGNPNGNLTNIFNFYPGVAYSPWIGVDAYDKQRRGFAALFTTFYNLAKAAYPTVPIFIVENGEFQQLSGTGIPTCSIQACHQDQYISDAMTLIPSQFPQIQGYMYFDNIGAYAYPSWDITQGTVGFNAYATMAANAYFRMSPCAVSGCAPTSPPAVAYYGGDPLFASTDVYYQDISQAAVDPNSATIINHMQEANITLQTPYVNVNLATNSTVTYPLVSTYSPPRVPIVAPSPTSMPWGAGFTYETCCSDHHALSLNTNTGIDWEMYGFNRPSGGTIGVYGGHIWNTAASLASQYGPAEWTGGAVAGDMPMIVGWDISDRDAAGVVGAVIPINHAGAFYVARNDVAAGGYVRPANSSTGVGCNGSGCSSQYLVFGDRLRLRAAVIAAKLPCVAAGTCPQAAAAAAQWVKYGMFLDDTDGTSCCFGAPRTMASATNVNQWNTSDLSHLQALGPKDFDVIARFLVGGVICTGVPFPCP